MKQIAECLQQSFTNYVDTNSTALQNRFQTNVNIVDETLLKAFSKLFYFYFAV